MPSRVALNTLNGSTIDILNTIRANAPAEYQASIPTIASPTEIPKVGEVIYGYPALANHFISALVNRIAAVRIKSATFNNKFAELKKGYLEFGETVEEAFANITKAREFSPEKASARELQRSLPDVKTAFHVMNYQAQYPVTIQDEDLKRAFLAENGVQDLIARIVDAVYTANEWDEYNLFKYLVIKAVTAGEMGIQTFNQADDKYAAIAFRSASNQFEFLSTTYNAAGVHNATPKADQFILMDAAYNAQFDVNVLASAFNMDKADFMGRLILVDSFTTFDNDRFTALVSDGSMGTVTDAELTAMSDIKAVLIDREWFQVYDNLSRISEKYVANGLYWNYFYNSWKTVSYSPFSNALAFKGVSL